MVNPRVSVIMACYNAEKTVASAIDSILAQTETNFEFIIVDDASTDQTRKVIQRYLDIDRRISVIFSTENKGLAYCLNRAITQANAFYIARMDADDVSLPHRFVRQLAYLEEHPAIDVLGTATQLIDEHGNLIGIVRLPGRHDQILKQRYLRPLFIHPSVMFRRSFFDRVGLYDERLHRTEDLDLWLRGQRSAIYGNLPDVLIQYTYKPRLPYRTFRSDILVRFRHMRASGELLLKGYELLLYSLRFGLLAYTGYTSQSLRKPRSIL